MRKRSQIEILKSSYARIKRISRCMQEKSQNKKLNSLDYQIIYQIPNPKKLDDYQIPNTEEIDQSIIFTHEENIILEDIINKQNLFSNKPPDNTYLPHNNNHNSIKNR